MKLAIISDVHDNLPNLKKVLDYCARNEIKNIICCGDLGDRETLDFLNDNFEGEIFFAWGNVEQGHFQKNGLGLKYKKTNTFEDYGEASFNGLKVAFVHYPEKAEELCLSGKYSFVFHGHTHKPWSSSAPNSAKATKGDKASDGQGRNCVMLNPGNVAGIIYPPTFAVWNTENNKFELIRVHELK